MHVIILHSDDANLNALKNELVFHQFSLMALCWLHLIKLTMYDNKSKHISAAISQRLRWVDELEAVFDVNGPLLNVL